MEAGERMLWFLVGVGVALLVVAISLDIAQPREAGYKRGQIDALTGKVKYERVTHPDSTVTWERRK